MEKNPRPCITVNHSLLLSRADRLTLLPLCTLVTIVVVVVVATIVIAKGSSSLLSTRESALAAQRCPHPGYRTRTNPNDWHSFSLPPSAHRMSCKLHLRKDRPQDINYRPRPRKAAAALLGFGSSTPALVRPATFTGECTHGLGLGTSLETYTNAVHLPRSPPG